MNIVNLIKNSQNVLIVGHLKPDGDCFGAGLSLLRVCEKYQKTAFFVCDSEISKDYAFMKGYQKTNVFEPLNFDLLIAVDCGDSARMGKYKEYLKKVKTTVNIDHHISNNAFAKMNYVKPQASSTCQLIFELIEGENVLDSDIASLLYVGLSTDTGHFMHSTVNGDVFHVATKLVENGAVPFEIAENLYKSRTVNKTMLISKAIRSLRFCRDNEIAFISISLLDLQECGCALADTEGLIDYASSIIGVKVSVCIAEQKEKVYKIGLRSKGSDVSKIASTFGGGGHIRASGCVITGFYEDVICKLERAINCQLDLEETVNERNN